MHPKTILGIDPGTKEMGFAVLRDRSLLGGGVQTLRNGEHPHNVVGHAKQVLLWNLKRYGPTVVGIEKPIRMNTKRAALMSVIVQELHARSRELGLEVCEIWPHEVRDTVTGDPYAKKIEVARFIVDKHFPDLRPRLPVPPRRAVLGFSSRDRYWLHMFDALAVAIAARDTIVHRE